jgi:hypothetical protein
MSVLNTFFIQHIRYERELYEYRRDPLTGKEPKKNRSVFFFFVRSNKDQVKRDLSVEKSFEVSLILIILIIVKVAAKIAFRCRTTNL